MAKKFYLNGKEYEAKEFTFNLICDFEEWGIPLSDIQKHSFGFIRAYIAACMGIPRDLAGREIEQHIIKGGTLNEIQTIMTSLLDESDFFKSLQGRGNPVTKLPVATE